MQKKAPTRTAPLNARQQLLMLLVEALGGTVAQTDFQKLLFLYTNEVETEPSFEFVPYRFGCFSFASYADRRRLIDRGFLEDDDTAWRLTKKGNWLAREGDFRALNLFKFARRYKGLRGVPLIAEVYRRHPYYAIRSEILAEVLVSPKDREKVEAVRPPRRKPGLLTVGYEGKSLEAYLNQLIQADVDLLCDVRRNPLSRKYGFSKSTLSDACLKVGIRYEHLPELGIASSERRDLSGKEDYQKLFATYEEYSLSKNEAALDCIQSWIGESRLRVALTCFERDPLWCHRHCITQAIAARTRQGLVALDLP